MTYQTSNHNRNRFIGITEAGDAGNDLSWYHTLRTDERYLGAVLVTKSGEKEAFQEKALKLLNYKPLIVHFGCTGWGGTAMEPGCTDPDTLIASIRTFIDNGFPASNIVFRTNPIIPTDEGLKRAEYVLRQANNILPDVKRRRLSIYDDYHSAREEMQKRGYEAIDSVTKWKNEMERRPTRAQIETVADMILSLHDDLTYELCAEPELGEFMPEKFHWCGCISEIDCALMGIEVPENMPRNGQKRFGCQCLQFKKELLSHKCRCCNNCAYCYWGRS